MDKEEKYTDIRNKLRNLEPVKAGDNFVHNLNSRIIEIEAEKRKVHEKKYDEGRGGFLKNLFGNMQYPWLVPAAGFTVLIFFVFYVTFLSKNASENIPQITSDKKQEITEQKTPPLENNASPDKEPLTETESGKTLNDYDKDKLSGKDIAGDMRSENKSVQQSPLENNNQFTDKDDNRNYRQELKAVNPDQSDGLSSDATEDKNDQIKENSVPGRTENNGMVSEEQKEAVSPEITRSSELSESQTYAEQKENSKTKKSSKDSTMNKLNERLKMINGESLEKIRDEINK